MDYKLLRIYAKNAFLNYKSNRTNFNDQLKMFYQYGKENPSVAQMLLKEEILNGTLQLDKTNTKIIKRIAAPMDDFYLEESPEYFEYKYSGIYQKTELLINAAKILKALKNNMLDEINPLVLEIKKTFDAAFKKLYPKTGAYRQYLLNKSDVKDALIEKYSAK